MLLRDEPEWTAIAAPLCIWPVSLCTLNSLHVMSRAFSAFLYSYAGHATLAVE